MWNIIGALIGPLIGLLFKSKADKDKALLKFQEFISKRKGYTDKAKNISDDYMEQLEGHESGDNRGSNKEKPTDTPS